MSDLKQQLAIQQARYRIALGSEAKRKKVSATTDKIAKEIARLEELIKQEELVKSRKPRERKQKTRSTDVERRELVRDAVELRIRGLEFADIAARQGCDVSTAYRRVQAGMRDTLELTKPAADQLRAEHNARLGRYLDALSSKAQSGDMQAIDRAIKILERLAKLNGLDAPSKQEITGVDGGPLDIRAVASEFREKLMKLSDAELEAEAKRLGVAE